MKSLKLKLLGRFEALTGAGALVPLPGTRATYLLAYLACSPTLSQSRERLTDVFWGDRGESQARASLRQLLWTLRKTFDGLTACPLLADGDFIALDSGVVDVDALVFERLLRTGRLDDLTPAVSLYRGDLLEGLDLRDKFDDDLLFYERERYRGLALTAMNKLLASQLTDRATGQAIETAHKLLAIDPLQEEVHRTLIGQYASLGQPGLALSQYELCRETLQRELGIKPSKETEAARFAIGKPADDWDAAARAQRKTLSGTAAPATRNRRMWSAAIAGGILTAGAIGVFWFRSWQPSVEPASVERMALPLPNRPSIAILPLTDLSEDGDHRVFANGFTDDLITDLSKVSGLFVISRDSSFVYGDESANIKQVAEELGVRFVLEGTVRRSRDTVRINVQLIDAVTGRHVWAERYDRDNADLFNVQDDVINSIVSALSIQLTDSEQRQLARLPTNNLEAYDYYLRAEQLGYYTASVEEFGRAFAFYERAIELDPAFAEAYAGYARTAVEIWRRDYDNSMAGAVARSRAYEAAGQALALDPENGRAYTVLALIQLVDGHHEEAIASARKAVGLRPNDAEAYAELGLVLAYAGHARDAVAEIERARRLNPKPSAAILLLSGLVHYTDRDYGRAIDALTQVRDALPRSEPAREYLAASYAHQGNITRAQQERDAVRRTFPEANLTYFAVRYDYYRRSEDLAHHLEGLRKAGFPVWPYDFDGADEDRIAGRDLPSLMIDRTWVGKHHGGVEFVQHVDAQGRLAYRSTNSFLTGTARIRGNMVCQRIDSYSIDQELCGHVYRITDSGGASYNYVYVNPVTWKYFNVAD